MAHTPGPWKVGRGADANKVIAEGNPPTCVAEVWYRPERFENAQLLAAAPALLAACEFGGPEGDGPAILEQIADALEYSGINGWPNVLRQKAEMERAAATEARREG